MEIPHAKTDGSQNASGERGGYAIPIAVSPNPQELYTHCQTSGRIVGSFSSFPDDPSYAAASCASNSWDLPLPGWDDGFIPIACDRNDLEMGSNVVGLRSNSFLSRKRRRSGVWKRGSGKSSVVMVDSKKTGNKKEKIKGDLSSNNNHLNKSKQMGEGPFSALEQPKMFYNKAMVLSPWSQLKPVVGRILMPLQLARESPRSRLPHSAAVKEQHAAACRSVEMTMVQLRSGSRPAQDRSSLADCLALSFEEAANDDTPGF